MNSKKHSKVPRQASKMAESICKHPSDEWLVSKICQEQKHSRENRPKNPVWKMSKRPTFAKEDMKMAKGMKKCSAALIIRQMQIKLNGVTPHTCWNSYCHRRGNT